VGEPFDLASYSSDEEAELVRLAKARSSEAWSRLYDQNQHLLFRYAYARLGDREEAADVAAQVFLEALNAIDRFAYRGRPLLAWLYGIAHNLVAQRQRQRARSPQATQIEGADSELGLDALELREAIERLTPDQRDIIVLRFIVGMSTTEIGRLLGKKVATVYSIQVRAIASLKRALSP
jgi:RNA polymerase sigma-70 factor (ECF subfamily)